MPFDMQHSAIIAALLHRQESHRETSSRDARPSGFETGWGYWRRVNDPQLEAEARRHLIFGYALPRPLSRRQLDINEQIETAEAELAKHRALSSANERWAAIRAEWEPPGNPEEGKGEGEQADDFDYYEAWHEQTEIRKEELFALWLDLDTHIGVLVGPGWRDCSPVRARCLDRKVQCLHILADALRRDSDDVARQQCQQAMAGAGAVMRSGYYSAVPDFDILRPSYSQTRNHVSTHSAEVNEWVDEMLAQLSRLDSQMLEALRFEVEDLYSSSPADDETVGSRDSVTVDMEFESREG